jgi:hypothetical protein
MFVPPVGEIDIQKSGGVKAFTTNDGKTVDSWVVPGASGAIKNLDIKGPASGDTNTTVFGKTKDVSFLGNKDDNTATFVGKSKDLQADMGAGNDQVVTFSKSVGSFISLGQGDNKAIAGGDLKDAFFSSGSGKDDLKLFGKVSSSTFTTGGGDDSLIFGGTVKGSKILVGDGADKVVFSDKVQNTNIDLGGDNSIDKVIVNSAGDLGKGVRITGAGEGDQLIIGGEEYVYNDNQQAFISGHGDTIHFG